jgi:hypothetical protein
MARPIFHKVFRLGLLTGAIMVLAAGSAAAQAPRCVSRDDLVSALGKQYNEKQNAYGWISPEAILEVFASEKGTWTVVLTGADGVSCVLAVGVGWENLQPPAGESGLRNHM